MELDELGRLASHWLWLLGNRKRNAFVLCCVATVPGSEFMEADAAPSNNDVPFCWQAMWYIPLQWGPSQLLRKDLWYAKPNLLLHRER